MAAKSKPEIAEEAEVNVAPRLSDNELTEQIIGAAIEVHRHLGPGLLESAHEECLCYELSQRGVRFRRQVDAPIQYKAIRLSCGHKMDLVVEDSVVVELKAVDDLIPIHTAQVLTYLKASGKKVGLLINFNVSMLRRGVKRIVNQYEGPRPSTPNSASSASHPTEQSDAEALSHTPRISPRLRVSAVNKYPPVKPCSNAS